MLSKLVPIRCSFALSADPQLNIHLLLAAFLQILQENSDNLLHIVLRQRMEHDDLVNRFKNSGLNILFTSSMT